MGCDRMKRDGARRPPVSERPGALAMPLTIPDDLLAEAGLSERDARIEIACRLYDACKLPMPAAIRWAGLSRTEFEQELLRRKLPLCRPTSADLKQDLETLQRLEE